MAKSSKSSPEAILSSYMDYVLTNNKQPESVYVFTKTLKIEESDFYVHYNSFDTLEKEIFNAFFKNTHSLLEKSENFISYDSRNKLLSFYFTFFELLTANRSYVVYVLHAHKNSLKSLGKLSVLKESFGSFVDHIGIEKLEMIPDHLKQFQNKGIKELTWLQLLITIQFWLNDTSSSFEKTDIFIEKSINTSFDVFDSKPLKSILDLGKFLFKEKSNFKM